MNKVPENASQAPYTAPLPKAKRKGQATADTTRRRKLRRRPLGRYRYVRLRWRVTFAVIDFLGQAVFRAGRALRRLLTGRTPLSPGLLDDPKVILLVQLDHLGDAIITTAILPELRRRYPGASIEVLAGAWNREVFEACPEVDRVHVSRINRFARGGLGRLAWIPATFCWGLRLRRRKVDLGLDVRGEFPLAMLLWLCGSRRRVGWAAGGGGFLLTDTAEFEPDRPEIESRWALVSQLGIRPPKTADARGPRFRPSSNARREIARRLPSSAQPLVVLHVGAGTPAKGWPAEHWEELLGRMIVAHGPRVVLVGSDTDRNVARQILGGRRWPGVDDWTGQLSVMELSALLAAAEVFVGADSGPAHLAAAVGTPAVVLFSGTNSPRQWRPFGRQVTVVRHVVDCSPCHRQRCPLPDHPCMNRLRPEDVAAAVTRLLAGRPRDTSRLLLADGTAVVDPLRTGVCP